MINAPPKITPKIIPITPPNPIFDFNFSNSDSKEQESFKPEALPTIVNISSFEIN